MPTHDDMLEILRKACDEAGNQKKWALANDYHPSFVSDVLNGRRRMPERMLDALDYEPASYQKKS